MARTPYDPNDPNALPLDQQGIDPQAARDALTSQMDPSMGTPPDAQTGPLPDYSTTPAAPTSTAPTVARTTAPAQTFTNTSTVTAPPTGTAGTYAPGSQNDPLWSQAGSDPSVLTQMLNSPTAGGVTSGAQLAQLYNQRYGRTTGNEAVYYNDNRGETIGFPTGYLAKTGQGWTWTARGPEGSPAGAPPAAPSAAPAGPAAPTASYQPVPQSSFNNGLRDFLMNQLHGLETPIDANNPELSPAISAYTTQSQRDQQAERDALAERYYASGPGGGSDLNSGGFNTAVQQGMENAAGKRANFSGSMVFQANQARRSQLQGMLSTAVQAGLTDQAQAIQQQIAELDAKLRQQGITNQSNQASDQLGLNYNQLLAQLNRDSMLGAMNG